MPALSRLSTAIKAARQLGLTQVGLNALYKFGLVTGHYRRAIRPPAPVNGLQIQPLLPLPARDEILSILGKDGQARLLAEADEIVAGKYRQFGGEPVEIDLAPAGPLAHWTEYETGAQRVAPLRDIKFTWEPARFSWAFTLGRAYHLTGDETYAGGFWRYFETFEQANPPYLGPNWMSGQEVGIRLMVFVWAAQIFSSSAHTTPARLAALAASTAIHAARIPATLVYARSQNNNHLLTESAALYTAGLALPGHPDAARWRKLGQKWLTWCFENQIDIHGEYVQHSTNYQRLMLQTALWVHVIAGSAATRQSPDDTEIASGKERPRNDTGQENLAIATHWLLSLLDPESGRVPNLGANDGATIFPLSSSPFSDFRPVAQAAARAFLNITLSSGPWDEMALWFGLPRNDQHSEITRYPSDHIYAENSWGMLRAIRYTSRPSHADQLHLDLWWRGLNIAQDAGTYLYNADPPWDNQLTSTLVHNTVSVDGLEQMTRAGRFLYLDWAAATSKQHFETGADFLQRFSAVTDAYTRLGVCHIRTVTVIQDERWLVEDELLNTSQTPHTFRLHWLLPDWEWELANRGSEFAIRLKSPHGPVTLSVSTDLPVKRTGIIRAGELIHGDGLVSPIFGWVSPIYEHKVPALSLAVEVQSVGNIKFTSEFKFPLP